MEEQIYRFHWQGIEIEAIYMPHKWEAVAHLEIRSINPERAPLPITDTGYHSSFHERDFAENEGNDIVEQIIACLDEEAKQSHWQESRQYSLF